MFGGENFPYANFHDLNMDWIIKIAKDFLDQYSQIQTTLNNGLESLDARATELTALLDQWYNSHSEDIANQLADALSELQQWYNTHSSDIENDLHQAIITFQNEADNKTAQSIASIPADYSDLSEEFNIVKDAVKNDIIQCVVDTRKNGGASFQTVYTYNNDSTYTIQGTTQGTSFLNLTDPNKIAFGIVPNETYFFNYNDPTNSVYFEIWVNGSKLTSARHPYWFTTPASITSAYFRLATVTSDPVDTTVAVPTVSTLKSSDGTRHITPDFNWNYADAGYTTLIKAISIGNVELSEGIFESTQTIPIPQNHILKGSGIGSTIINFTATTGMAIHCSEGNEQIKDLTLKGGLNSKPDSYLPTNNKRGIVIDTETNLPTYIVNTEIIGFSKDGILIQNRGYTSLCSLIANNLKLQFNGSGITFTEKGEYGVITNCIITDNYFGCVDSGGNNKISNCGIDRNTVGLFAGEVNNDTHSDVIGCSFNHCTSIGIEVYGITSMITFTACQSFGAGDWDAYAENAQTATFMNCLFGRGARLKFDKGEKDAIYILNNCVFANSPSITKVGTTDLKVINCYTQDGTAVA